MWVADDLFGTAVRCGGPDGADDGATLSISRLRFGRAGPWAINMWVRQADNAGSAFQYLLSTAHSGGMSNDSVFEPNQVRPCCCTLFRMCAHLLVRRACHCAHGDCLT